MAEVTFNFTIKGSYTADSDHYPSSDVEAMAEVDEQLMPEEILMAASHVDLEIEPA